MIYIYIYWEKWKKNSKRIYLYIILSFDFILYCIPTTIRFQYYNLIPLIACRIIQLESRCRRYFRVFRYYYIFVINPIKIQIFLKYKIFLKIFIVRNSCIALIYETSNRLWVCAIIYILSIILSSQYNKFRMLFFSFQYNKMRLMSRVTYKILRKILVGIFCD